MSGKGYGFCDNVHALFVTAMKDAEVRNRMAGFGFEPIGNTPEEFAAFVKEDIARWAKLVKETGAKVE
jgi:tripartite-type tricarboxylate transporter receptor subunit TctC